MLTPVLVVGGIAGLILAIVAFLIARGRSEYEIAGARRTHVNSMRPELAKSRAEVLLDDASLFACVPAKNALPIESGLPEGVVDLLGRFERIEALVGPGVVVDRSIALKASHGSPYRAIGEGSNDSEPGAFSLCVEPTGERVVEVYGKESVDPVFGSYTSIYHWVILTAQESKPLREM